MIMGFCASFGRCILILLNIIILLVAIALIAVGALLKFFPGQIFNFVLNVVTSTVRNSLPFDTPLTVEFLPVINDVGVALLVIGCVLFLVAFFACCGACCQWRVLLILFVILMSILVIAQCVVGGLFLTKDSTIHTTLQKNLRQQLKSEYSGSQATDVFSLMMNLLMYRMKCCGIVDKTDFNGGKVLKESYQRYEMKAAVPIACCNETLFLTQTSPHTDDLKRCVENADDNFLNSEGCYSKLYEYVDDNRTYAIIGLVFVELIQVVLVMFGIALTKQIGDQKIGII